MERMNKLALHWQIIIGLVVGLIYGLIAANAGWQDFTVDWIAPWGGVVRCPPDQKPVVNSSCHLSVCARSP